MLDDLRARLGVSSGPVALVSFTIAGVQEFLVAARTTRDVWNGSYLLSYLAFEATQAMLRKALEQAGQSSAPLSSAVPWVLLPNVERQPLMDWALGRPLSGTLSIANFPNQVLLAIPGNRSVIQPVANAGERGLTDTWNEIQKAGRDQFAGHGLLNGMVGQTWDYQVAPHRVFELYWSGVALPTAPDALRELRSKYTLNSASPYGALVELAGKVLGARKMTRSLEQVGEEGRRCSLCGARSALADYAGYDSERNPSRRGIVIQRYGRLRAYWERVRKEFPFQFRSAERLCAVCVVRRLAPRYYFEPLFKKHTRHSFEYRFPSTSTIATASAVAGVVAAASNPSVGDAVRRFDKELRKTLRNTGIRPVGRPVPYIRQQARGLKLHGFPLLDGDWFYPDTYQADSLANEYGGEPKNYTVLVQQGRRALEQLHSTLKQERVEFEPGNYVAIIAVDGDKMGDWVSGVLSGADFTLKWQTELSGHLAKFAAAACDDIENRLPGRVVYAGGDDVLAFVPADKSLAALQALHRAYSTIVAGTVGKPLTISMACVLARHNDPLSASIAKVQHLLKHEAKAHRRRDAFVLYRTTEGVVTGAKNAVLEPLRQVWDYMASFVGSNGVGLSAGLVSSLGRYERGFGGWSGTPDAIEAVLRWQAMRHTRPRGATEEDRNAYRLKVADAVAGLYTTVRKSIEDERRGGNTWAARADPFRELLGLLDALRFLTRSGS